MELHKILLFLTTLIILHSVLSKETPKAKKNKSLNGAKGSRTKYDEEVHRMQIGSEAKPEMEACPMGCRCTAGPRLHARHHWHRILGAYRTHRLVYGPGRDDFNYLPPRNPHRPIGREMTCVGLLDMPDYLPSDVSRVVFFGSMRETWEEQSDEPEGEEEDFDNMVNLDSSLESAPNSLHQLTSVSKLNSIKSRTMRHLEIQGNRIKALKPNDFEMLTSLRHLHMKNNRVKVISVGTFKGLDHIQDIDLSENHIRHLPKATFRGLSHLRKVNLAKNRLPLLHEKIFTGLEKLQHLDISFNYITDMPKDIFLNTPNIKVMTLSDNHLKHVRPEWVSHMTKLQKLNLKGNRIYELGDHTFDKIQSLNTLNLDKNQLKELGRYTFAGLRNLKTLYLGNNNISFVQNQAFSHLTKLLELYLDNNNIDTITAETLAGLGNLQKLSLEHNRLDGVRKEIFVPVQGLQFLDLSYNKIKLITNRNFYGLLELRELRLDHNEIRSVEDDGFAVSIVNTFSQMTWLHLSFNKLDTITRRMFTGLNYLKYLNLGHNDIEIVDESGLSVFSRLNTIVLSGNKIYDILPATFKQLSHLKLLNMGNNKLRHIRFSAFLGLDNVEELSLQNNDVSSIDTGVFLDTPKLRSLNLKKNRMDSFNLNILDRLPKMKYLDLSQNTVRLLRIPSTPLRQLFSLSLADNYLQKLSQNITGVVNKRGSILLYGNPWNCNCELEWLLSGNIINDVYIANVEQLICKSPRHLGGEKIQALDNEDFCPQSDTEQVTDGTTDLSTTDQSIACGFSELSHTLGMKSQTRRDRHEPLRWMVNFFNKENNWMCTGVRIQNGYVLTHSSCWKLIGPGEPMKIGLGSLGNKVAPDAIVIKDVQHFTGPLDFALVKISKAKAQEDERVFPCILDSEGLALIKANTTYVIVAPTITNKRETKVRPLMARTIADPCVNGYLCLSVNEEKYSRSKYQTEFVPTFVKMGKSRWALTSIGQLKAYGNVLTTPLVELVSWIDDTIQ